MNTMWQSLPPIIRMRNGCVASIAVNCGCTRGTGHHVGGVQCGASPQHRRPAVGRLRGEGTTTALTSRCGVELWLFVYGHVFSPSLESPSSVPRVGVRSIPHFMVIRLWSGVPELDPFPRSSKASPSRNLSRGCVPPT